MNRLTDNDKNFGPITISQWAGKIGVIISSGGEHDYAAQCHLMLHGFGWAMRIQIPNIIPPLRIKHVAESWDKETVMRLGRNWYYETHEREFGVAISEMGNGYDFVQVRFGAQTHDSKTTKSWCYHLPWKQWRMIRNSVYNPDGSHFATEDKNSDWRSWDAIREKCPVTHFLFQDYDGESIVATCRVEEMEWRKGRGWFKWLGVFCKPKIRRSLDLKFSEEVGPEKGSWKGGTIGHSVDMLPGESPEMSFRRYCQMDHDRKGRKYRLQFICYSKAPDRKTKTETQCGQTSENLCQ
jgi:hypothetical protein